MNELEGLSRGCKPSQSAMHSAMVRETARAAMTILQNKHPALRCVTTRGTVLNSSTFIIEEDTPQVSAFLAVKGVMVRCGWLAPQAEFIHSSSRQIGIKTRTPLNALVKKETLNPLPKILGFNFATLLEVSCLLTSVYYCFRYVCIHRYS